MGFFRFNPKNKTDKQLYKLYWKYMNKAKQNLYLGEDNEFQLIKLEFDNRGIDIDAALLEEGRAKFNNCDMDFRKCRLTDDQILEKESKEVVNNYSQVINSIEEQSVGAVHDISILPRKKDKIKKSLKLLLKEEKDLSNKCDLEYLYCDLSISF